MLHGFFDDSGTHQGSRVGAWGGLVGVSEHFFKLDSAWKQLLAEPLPGKPPIQKFGVADCRWGFGDFENYSPGERDHARFLFRQAIVDSGMIPFSYAVDAKAWDEVVTGAMKEAYACNGAGVAFSGCADRAIAISKRVSSTSPYGQMVCVFDAGQQNAETQSLLGDAEKRAKESNVPVAYTFAAVSDVTGLQAADTIATETFWSAKDYLTAGIKKPSVHFQSFLNKTKFYSYLLERPQILQMRKQFRAMPNED